MPEPDAPEAPLAPKRRISFKSLLDLRRPNEPVPEFDEIRNRSMRWVSENPGLIATLGYLYLTAIGVAYSVIYYGRFDVAILDLSEPTDFLAAGLREPMLILISVVSFLVLRRFMANDRRWRDRWAWYRTLTAWVESSRFYSRGLLYATVALGYFLTFAVLYAQGREGRIREGRGHRVVVDLNLGGVKTLGADGRLELLGVNGRFLFLYSLRDCRTTIVPISNVGRVYDLVVASRR